MFIRSIVLASIAAVAAGKSLRFEGGGRDLQEGQPSTKFAASWTSEPQIAKACMNADVDFNEAFWGNSTIFDIDTICPVNVTQDSNAVNLTLSQFAELGRIKIPQNQEILVTLSAQIDILTVNQATSKKPTDSYWGNIGGTYSQAGVRVVLNALSPDGTVKECEPGEVMMASRAVELKNVIGGNVTYEDCTGEEEGEPCATKVADVELQSSIGLAMDTAAAHSFQFLCVDMVSDTYDVFAEFRLGAEVASICDDVLGGSCADIADFAAARVALQKRMLTVQQVRMANQIELS